MGDGRLIWIDWEGRRRPRQDVIRELHRGGMSVGDIGRRLGIRYQVVRQTILGDPNARSAQPLEPRPMDVDNNPVDAFLLGCVKTKDVRPRPAKDLYTSELFRRRRRYAEAAGRPWWIVSAEYGLVAPDEVIAPYDTLIGRRPRHERDQIARQVADRLSRELGGLTGKRLELHMGDEYVLAIGPRLRQQGAILVRPLEGLSFGQGLAWYGERLGLSARAASSGGRAGRPPGRHAAVQEPLGDGRGLAQRITAAFVGGNLDLSERPGAPTPGWDEMPEVVAVRHLRQAGADDIAVRRFLTFNAAMDRARDADRLAAAAARLFTTEPWVFDPGAVVRRPLRELADVLRLGGVSQRHTDDVYAWRIIAETLADRTLAPAAYSAINNGEADAGDLLAELGQTTRSATRLFPLLGGPKIGPLWVRLLAHPGGARITSLGLVPVAVDVQVRKVTEYLGVTETRGRELDDVRAVIQLTWAADVAAHGAVGPGGLADTAGALDPALWFYGKWGCSHCERIGRQRPVADTCRGCRLE